MTRRLRLAVVLRQEQCTRRHLDEAAFLENEGIDVIGVPEVYGLDAVSQLGYLAAQTERVQLTTQILPIYTRSPALIAMTAAGLDEVSGGRFILGLGASGPQVIEGWHAVRYDAPIARTREIVEVCEAVWRRDRLEHRGPHYEIPLPPHRPIKMIHHPIRPRIPINLAALGIRNVALAAEIADGWVPTLYFPERADSVWGDALKQGKQLRSPNLAPLEITAGGMFAITSDPKSLRDLARPSIALYIGGMGSATQNFYSQVVRRYGFGDEAAKIQHLYLNHERAAAEAAISPELLDALTIVGDLAYVRDRVEAYAGSGVTVLRIDAVGPDRIGDIRQLRALVENVGVAE